MRCEATVKQILIIDSIELWLSLNRHLAGQEFVRVAEASSLEMGIRLAQVQSPDLLVCDSDGAGQSPAELSRLFQKARLDGVPVICVHDRPEDAPPGEPVGPLEPVESGDTDFRVCSPDEFLQSVDRLIATTEQSGTAARVQLLAHFQTISGLPGEPQRGFVNLLEIDSDALLIESSEPLQIGDSLDLTFHIPPQGDSAPVHERTRISLRCQVHSCQDDDKLFYRIRLLEVDKRCEGAFRHFIDGLHAERESPR